MFYNSTEEAEADERRIFRMRLAAYARSGILLSNFNNFRLDILIRVNRVYISRMALI